MKPLIAILTLLLAAGCSSGIVTPIADHELYEIDRIREAVYRYQFVHNYSGQQQQAQVYFLSARIPSPPEASTIWSETDPSSDLLARFEGHQPPVRPWSQSTTSVYGVFDRTTGERGLLFNVSSIIAGGDTAQVEGGYFEGGLSASGNTYYLRRVNSSWSVEYDILHWISNARPDEIGVERNALP